MGEGASESQMLLLGKIMGQLRELIHNSNNNSAKLDALSLRVAALEVESGRRAGAGHVVQTILKSPVIAWLVTVGAAIWAVATGKISP